MFIFLSSASVKRDFAPLGLSRKMHRSLSSVVSVLYLKLFMISFDYVRLPDVTMDSNSECTQEQVPTLSLPKSHKADVDDFGDKKAVYSLFLPN
jgi:hypothetical protein